MMKFELPKKLKPIVDLALHVVLAAAAFLVVIVVAIGISAFIRALQYVVVIPRWVVISAETGEKALFFLDFFCAAAFIVVEAVRFFRTLVGGGE